MRPLFGPDEGAIHETLAAIDLPAFLQVGGEGSEHPFERPVAHPRLEAAMHRRVRRVSVGQVLPLCAGSEYPQHAIEDGAAGRPRPAPSIRATWRCGDQRIESCPLFIRQVPAACSSSHTAYHL